MLHRPTHWHCKPQSVQIGARCAHVPVQALRRATTAPVLPVRKHLSVTVCAASLPKQDDWRQTHKRLLDLFVEQTIQYVATTSGQGITRGEALTCLQQPQLLASSPPYPGLFRHLYRTFRQRKVRVAIGDGSPRDQRKGISFIDPRCPANILHPDPTAVSAGEPYADAPKISSAVAHLRHGYKLVRPQLLCVGFLMPTWRDRPETEYRYATWPLECCWYHPDKKAVKDPGDDGWPDASQQLNPGSQASSASNPMHIPGFVLQACLSQGLVQPTKQACGEPLPAATRVAVLPGRLLPALNARARASTAAAGSTTESSGSSSAEASASSIDSKPAPETASNSARAKGNALPNSNWTALGQLSVGFKNFTACLAPTKDENKRVKAVVFALHRVLNDIAKTKVWSVAQVLPVGSAKKRTGLRASSNISGLGQDLDVQITIHAPCGRFKEARSQCLACLDEVLRQSTAAAASSTVDAHATSGWIQVSSMPQCLKLKHPVLDVRMDVQACEHLAVFGAGSQWREEVLSHLLLRAQAAQTCSKQPQSPHPAVEALTNPNAADRDRAALLTPLMTSVFQHSTDNVNIRSQQEFSLTGAGAMVTSVIRAVKAWVQVCGLEGLLLPQSSSSSVDVGVCKYPSSYIWEIFVVFVLESRLQHCRENGLPAPYKPGMVGELLLFKDVLLEMSQRLRPVSVAKSAALAPIALTYLYTAEQLEWFRSCWGVGEISTPYIIHPADPSYNCRDFNSFMHWDALADAAGDLHQQLEQLLQQDAPEGGAWEAALKGTTLGSAVRAFADEAS